MPDLPLEGFANHVLDLEHEGLLDRAVHDVLLDAGVAWGWSRVPRATKKWAPLDKERKRHRLRSLRPR